MAGISVFSDLDASPDPDAALRYLDDTDGFMSAFKAYVAAALARYVPGGRVLDVGCGAGHDLARLAAAGLTPTGVDLSRAALVRARDRCRSVAQADGHRLPFRDEAFDGCRIERVLQHVADPGTVLDEVIRVVRPGGVLAVLEPDQSALRVASDVDPSGGLVASQALATHPTMGSQLEQLLRDRGCAVDDVVTERSYGYQLDGLPLKAVPALRRAVAHGLISEEIADAWLTEQAERTHNGTFRATWPKVLVVARTQRQQPCSAEGGRAPKHRSPSRGGDQAVAVAFRTPSG